MRRRTQPTNRCRKVRGSRLSPTRAGPGVSGKCGRRLRAFCAASFRGDQAETRSIPSEEASLVNPVDMIASATGEQFGTALSVISKIPSIDAAIVINIPVRPYQEVASGIQHELAGYKGDKTMVACFMMSGTDTVEIRTAPDRLVPVYMFPEDAVQAFFHSCTYSRYRPLKAGSVPVFPDADEERARKYLESSPVLRNSGWLPVWSHIELLKECGIPAAGTRTALTLKRQQRQRWR